MLRWFEDHLSEMMICAFQMVISDSLHLLRPSQTHWVLLLPSGSHHDLASPPVDYWKSRVQDPLVANQNHVWSPERRRRNQWSRVVAHWFAQFKRIPDYRSHVRRGLKSLFHDINVHWNIEIWPTSCSLAKGCLTWISDPLTMSTALSWSWLPCRMPLRGSHVHHLRPGNPWKGIDFKVDLTGPSSDPSDHKWVLRAYQGPLALVFHVLVWSFRLTDTLRMAQVDHGDGSTSLSNGLKFNHLGEWRPTGVRTVNMDGRRHNEVQKDSPSPGWPVGLDYMVVSDTLWPIKIDENPWFQGRSSRELKAS